MVSLHRRYDQGGLFYRYHRVLAILIFYGLRMGLSKRLGQHYTLSMLNQSIQTVMFCFGSVYFRYCAGAYIVADVDVTNEIKLGANVGLSLLHIGNNADDEWQLSFNLVAIWLLVYIYRLRQTKASMA